MLWNFNLKSKTVYPVKSKMLPIDPKSKNQPESMINFILAPLIEQNGQWPFFSFKAWNFKTLDVIDERPIGVKELLMLMLFCYATVNIIDFVLSYGSSILFLNKILRIIHRKPSIIINFPSIYIKSVRIMWN